MKDKFVFYMDKIYQTEHTVQMHTHPCYELTYYAEGTGATEVEDKKFSFIPDTFILAAPNAPHTETHKDRVSVICVGFETQSPLPSRLFVDKDRRVADTLFLIGRELKEKKTYYPAALDVLSELLVLNILRSAAGPARMSMDFDHVLNYVNAHANENTNAKKIAAELHYNYDYFRQNFFARMGVSASDYLQKTKINNAKKYLSESKLSVTEIARRTGFATPSHFCRTFSKLEGTSPMQFREKNKHPEFSDIHFTPTGNRTATISEREK